MYTTGLMQWFVLLHMSITAVCCNGRSIRLCTCTNTAVYILLLKVTNITYPHVYQKKNQKILLHVSKVKVLIKHSGACQCFHI